MLKQRFNMPSWFTRHGYPIERILLECAAKPAQAQAQTNMPPVHIPADCKVPASVSVAEIKPQQPSDAPEGAAATTEVDNCDISCSAAEAMQLGRSTKGRTLLVFDFDRYLPPHPEPLFELTPCGKCPGHACPGNAL